MSSILFIVFAVCVVAGLAWAAERGEVIDDDEF